jgi:hypothetical protein
VSTYLKQFDWAPTPLGSQASWSSALRTTYDILMASGFGMCAVWGPERTFLYNEAYIPFLAERHPHALGRPIDQVWFDVWSDIAPLIDRAMAGETVHLENLHLVMTREGYEEAPTGRSPTARCAMVMRSSVSSMSRLRRRNWLQRKRATG